MIDEEIREKLDFCKHRAVSNQSKFSAFSPSLFIIILKYLRERFTFLPLVRQERMEKGLCLQVFSSFYLMPGFLSFFVISAGDCDFETDTCSWTNAKGDDRFDWTRKKGQTASPITGPNRDHTTGTSKILHTNS
jgi:hypothetical protein